MVYLDLTFDTYQKIIEILANDIRNSLGNTFFLISISSISQTSEVQVIDQTIWDSMSAQLESLDSEILYVSSLRYIT